MPTIDDLIVRLDADIRPFCRALEAVDRKLKVIEKRSAQALSLPAVPANGGGNTTRFRRPPDAMVIE